MNPSVPLFVSATSRKPRREPQRLLILHAHAKRFGISLLRFLRSALRSGLFLSQKQLRIF